MKIVNPIFDSHFLFTVVNYEIFTLLAEYFIKIQKKKKDHCLKLLFPLLGK